ncbi:MULTISPECIES: HdeD family acid-resistance protein [Mycolicibacterium]|uniref:Membrane protein n=3 Tax=Actinomycetes TaxID=1760 RepID=A0A6N4UKJ1_9MYCO|nr:uncharacterized membrane protein HdeD (DUF308 family) [Mycolicibacterium lutetiense]BBX25320.1 membrane protein [Mycolicibacterium alvei]
MNASTDSLVTPKLVTALWQTALLWGLSAVLLGCLVLFWPGVSILVAAVLFGAYLFVSGILQVASAFGLHERFGSRALLFVSGAISVVLAVLAFRHFDEGYGVLFLAIWIGIGFVFQGASEIAVASGAPGLPGRGWQIVLGVITVIAGMVVLVWPFDSIVMLTIVTGVSLVIIGVAQIIKAVKLRSGLKKVEKGIDSLTSAG